MAKTHWHFPRLEFAQSTFSALVNGPLAGVSLFGPRRTGKTEFLTLDLAPLAADRGHRVVYANLWQSPESPLAILLYELDFGLRKGSILDRVQHAASELAPKFRLKNPIGAGEIEIDLSSLRGQAPDNLLLLLDQYCEKLANDKKPTLLLFDEFQELARSGPAARPLAAALRTSLEKRRNGLAAVFTGSSQERLRTMFSPTQAPFFRFAVQLDLPVLGRDFVDHQIAAFRKTFKAQTDLVEAFAIFENGDHNPLLLQRWLMIRGMHPNLDANSALNRVQADLAAEFGFLEKWLDLTPIQRAVARVLAERAPRVFSDEGAARIGALQKEAPSTPQRTQAAIRKLVRIAYVDKWDKDWRLADPLFEAWIRARPLSDF